MQKHYIAIDAFGWATSEDIDEAISKRQEDSGNDKIYLWVWEVPLPEDTGYEIGMYQPKVEGAVMVKELNK